MKTRIVPLGIAVFLVLSLGVGVWIGVEQLIGNSPAATLEISTSAEQKKQAFLEGIRQGRPLYQKEVRYQKHHPQNTIAEDWMVADEQGQKVAVASTIRDLEGNLLKYMKLHEDGTLTETAYLVEGHFSRSPFIPLGTDPGLEDIELHFSVLWDGLLALPDSGSEFKGRGTLNGRTSLIFEREHDDGVTLRIEVVENAPLLHSVSIYEDGILFSQTTVVERRFLPLGSALPDPPTHVQTVNY